MVYAAQQRLDGYDEAVRHAIKRKTAGQLVQVYRSNLNYTFKTEQKILPKWSRPYRVTTWLRNSYRLETLTGNPVSGKYSARRLRAFVPREGTQLYKDQQEYERKRGEQAEEEDRTAGEQEGVGNEGVEEKVEGETIKGQSAWQNTSEEPPDEQQQQRT
ncbi:hypothetical protein PISMIDRAFT_16921 [Pisolithus microcarpus 441]|uniref:Uncharacterized protein n=1 Tax=Pisolithus microcarpus 441 TaxID=765257 RepID=A0A0C9XRN5_9AGAM|nr:hypothetical protein PISMIDRAFT_16921 [Pisolithus microcarpus 441]